jgi:DNA-binding Lrp family transcriptional regulator
MEIRIPSKPEIEQKEPLPDRRRFSVVPLVALKDARLTPQAKVVLAMVCSYCNRAGITHVSQAKIAEDLGIDQSRVSRAMNNLKRKGYIEAIGKAMPGIRGKTIRVVYEPGITTEDAIAIAGNAREDDLRPESIKEQQHAELLAMSDKDWTAEELQANKERLAKMLIDAFKTSADKPNLYTPVQGDTLAVKKAKQEIRARMRQLRKEEFAQNAYNETQKQGSELVTEAYKHKELCFYADKASMTSEQVSACDKSIQTALAFEDVVVYMNKNLFNGVKTESDLDMCMRLSQVGVTLAQLEQHIASQPDGTPVSVGMSIIGSVC